MVGNNFNILSTVAGSFSLVEEAVVGAAKELGVSKQFEIHWLDLKDSSLVTKFIVGLCVNNQSVPRIAQ